MFSPYDATRAVAEASAAANTTALLAQAGGSAANSTIPTMLQQADDVAAGQLASQFHLSGTGGIIHAAGAPNWFAPALCSAHAVANGAGSIVDDLAESTGSISAQSASAEEEERE